MIRMIGNNTSDYVATDLIHQLWCQHDEKYGHLFPDEPHNSKRSCLFNHSRIDEVKLMYRTPGDSYNYPEYPDKINFQRNSFQPNPNQCKSNNYVYPEATYSQARLNMYSRKHNINGMNDTEENEENRNDLNEIW